jgi:hypothetical protein
MTAASLTRAENSAIKQVCMLKVDLKQILRLSTFHPRRLVRMVRAALASYLNQ